MKSMTIDIPVATYDPASCGGKCIIELASGIKGTPSKGAGLRPGDVVQLRQLEHNTQMIFAIEYVQVSSIAIANVKQIADQHWENVVGGAGGPDDLVSRLSTQFLGKIHKDTELVAIYF